MILMTMKVRLFRSEAVYYVSIPSVIYLPGPNPNPYPIIYHYRFTLLFTTIVFHISNDPEEDDDDDDDDDDDE